MPNWLTRPWFAGQEPTENRSVWLALQTGAAGMPLRIGLSLAALTLVLSVLMFVLSMIELGGRVRTEHVASGLAVGGAVWCGLLALVWSSYRRWRAVIQTTFIVLGIWLVTVPLCVLIGNTVRDGGFLIAACLLLSGSGSIVLIAANAYRATAGRPLADRSGEIIVVCPKCKYSMVGLDSCQCPECGSAYTLDQLIRDQDYGALRGSKPVDEPQRPLALPQP